MRNVRQNALRVIWNKALADKNAATLKALGSTVAATKPRGQERNQPPNQRRAWRIRKTAWQNSMRRAGNVVVNAELLRNSEVPSVVIHMLSRGVPTSALTAANMQRRFDAFGQMTRGRSPAEVDAYARMLAQLLRHGAPLPHGGHYGVASETVGMYLAAPSRAILDLMTALTERGVPRTEFAEKFFSEFGYVNSPRIWQRGLAIIRHLAPVDPNARAQYLDTMLGDALETRYMGPNHVQDMLDLGTRLSPALLDKYVGFWTTGVNTLNEMQRYLEVDILEMFQRARVRLPASYPGSFGNKRLGAEVARILRAHNLLETPKKRPPPQRVTNKATRRRV